MAKHSAGLLVHRRRGGRIQVFLVHPGGPFWARKERHAWSIPKGEFAAGEDPLAAARREFAEETGLAPPPGPVTALEPVRQPGGKVVHAFAVAGDLDASGVESNTFPMEWPPHSGETREFPEVDRAGWFDLAAAREKVHKGQIALLEGLEAALEG